MKYINFMLLNKKVITIKKCINFIVILFIPISCDFYSEEDAKLYLPGKYIYEHPSKEVEILEIDTNFTFKQTVYVNKEAFKENKKYLYYNSIGKLETDNNKIIFSGWLDIFNSDNLDIIKSNPKHISYTGVYWEKPTMENNVLITMYDQDNYVFKKISTAPARNPSGGSLKQKKHENK